MKNVTINEMKELITCAKRYGDIKNACLELGCTAQTFWNAMGRTDGNYSDIEILVLKNMYNRMVEHIELRKSVGLESC